MKQRLNAFAAAPDAYKAVLALEKYVVGSGLEPKLIHLVKLRASQINGCAFCIDMHVKEALDDGEDPQRLYLLSVWRETPIFDARERAALAWTETVTLLADTGVPDEDYEEARSQFAEADLVKLTVAIGAINVWNRLAVPFRMQHPSGMNSRIKG